MVKTANKTSTPVEPTNTDGAELIIKNTAVGVTSAVVATTHKVSKGGDYEVDADGNLVKTR